MRRPISSFRFLIQLILSIVLLMGVFSCKPANERSCIKRTGDMDSLEVELPHFDKLILGEHMKFVLIQDTIEKLRIHGGENLLNLINISTNTSTSEVIIENDNRCRFMRYKTNEIIVYIHFKQINELIFNGSDSLTNEGVLSLNNFKLETLGAAGSIALNIDANEIHCINESGWPDIEFSGSCNVFRVRIHGNQYFNSTQLDVNESITVISNAGTTSKINSQDCMLRVELSGTGDLWFYGVPTEIVKKEYNSGKLIDKN